MMSAAGFPDTQRILPRAAPAERSERIRNRLDPRQGEAWAIPLVEVLVSIQARRG